MQRQAQRRGRLIEDGVSLLTGAGLGMLAMYLLDPQSGRARRRVVAERAQGIAESAGATIGPAVATAGETLRDLGQRVSGTTSEYASGIAESGRGFFSSAGERISEGASGAMDRARSMFGGRAHRSRMSQASIPVIPGALGGVALLALGAGMIYLFDPQQGNRRRALLRNKGVRAINETTDFLRKAGRRVGDQMTGTYHETAARFRRDEPSDEQLCARVRSELGRMITNMGDVEVIAESGYVTLRGNVLQQEIDPAINAIMRVRGVRGVNNQLSDQSAVRGTPQSEAWPTSGQTPGSTVG